MFTRIAGVCVGGFLLGIFYASLFIVSTTLVTGFLCVALLLLVVSRPARVFAFAALGVCALVLGMVRFDGARVHYPPQVEASVEQKVFIEGVVIGEPDVRERNIRLTVDVSTFNGEAIETRMLVIAPSHSSVAYGDRISSEGKLHKPKAFESGAGRVFDYPNFLASRGVTYELSYAQVRVLEHGGNPIKAAMLGIKSVYIAGLRAVLPEPYAGLAAGITAGDKRSVGSELSDVFQEVSLVHILVLSGYNITIVLGACMGLLTRMQRTPQLLSVLLVVVFFAVISGGAASAMRAGAMAFCAVVASLYGRQFVALRVLGAIVFVMVVWNPYLLVYDPGFQLSVLATLGLILIAPYVERLLHRMPNTLTLREITAATIATQLSVLPLLLFSNGLLSIVSLPANLLALIAVPLAMVFSAIAAVGGIVFGTWGALIAFPAYLLLRYIVVVAEYCAAIPYASIEVGAFPPWMLFVVYGLILTIIIVLMRRYPLAKHKKTA